MHCAKDIAVVGHGNRGHAQLVDAVDKFFNVASAVEQRIIAMQMQVDELVLGHEAFSGSILFYWLELIAQRLNVVQIRERLKKQATAGSGNRRRGRHSS
jgi:hypothetical protein